LKKERDTLSKYGNDLRQTFKTVATEVGIGRLEAKLLMNHKVDSDVHDAYASRGALAGHLLQAQERISRAIVAKLGRIESELV
jgi:hypothetical protein